MMYISYRRNQVNLHTIYTQSTHTQSTHTQKTRVRVLLRRETICGHFGGNNHHKDILKSDPANEILQCKSAMCGKRRDLETHKSSPEYPINRHKYSITEVDTRLHNKETC